MFGVAMHELLSKKYTGLCSNRKSREQMLQSRCGQDHHILTSVVLSLQKSSFLSHFVDQSKLWRTVELLLYLIISQQIHKMNSPLKATFFEFDFNSSKKVVSCEINGWMETHIKPKVNVQPAISRFVGKGKVLRATSERSSISKLKEMKSSLLKNTMRKFSERTPPTAESMTPVTTSVDNSRQLQSERVHSQQKHGMHLRIVEVSEFKTEETTMPQIVGERKASLLRLRAMAKKGAKPTINHLLLGKEAEIIQNKVTEKQYCSLKFATRRLSCKLRP